MGDSINNEPAKLWPPELCDWYDNAQPALKRLRAAAEHNDALVDLHLVATANGEKDPSPGFQSLTLDSDELAYLNAYIGRLTAFEKDHRMVAEWSMDAMRESGQKNRKQRRNNKINLWIAGFLVIATAVAASGVAINYGYRQGVEDGWKTGMHQTANFITNRWSNECLKQDDKEACAALLKLHDDANADKGGNGKHIVLK